MGLRVESRMRAEEPFVVGNRVFHVVCEVRSMTAPGGHMWGTIVTPTALLVEEDGSVYSVSLTGEEIDKEAVLDLLPSLKERLRGVGNGAPAPDDSNSPHFRDGK
jgi:uncharacterized spore protein YtfJ